MQTYARQALAALKVRADEEAETNRYYGDGDRDEFLDCSVDSLARLLDSPECECVWLAIQRRADEGARTALDWAVDDRRPQRLRQSLALTDFSRDGALASVGRAYTDLVDDLIGAVAEFRLAPMPSITPSDRKAALARLESASRKLTRELELIAGDADAGVSAYMAALRDAGHNSAHSWAAEYEKFPPHLIDQHCEGHLTSLAANIYLHPSEVIAGIATAARAWAFAEPEVPRPNQSTARRNRFVRRLAAYFQTTYGSPLLRQVAVIANALHDDPPVDEAQVSDLIARLPD